MTKAGLVFLCILQSTSYAGAADFTQHMRSAADKKQAMQSRWIALLKAAQLASTAEQVVQLQKFSKDELWYMRNASLVALQKVNRQVAEQTAQLLIKDKALVVRSAAVDVLAENLNEQNKLILRSELNQPYNFNKKSSLWIRNQIIEKLKARADESDRDFFVKGLYDSDTQIALHSAQALEKITGQRPGKGSAVEGWKEIVKRNKWY